MKKLLFSLLLINFTVFAQEINLYPIEDSNLLSYLQGMHPQTIVNDSLDVNATGGIETLLLINDLNLTSIDGIQYFNDLTYLDCSSNQLTTLPELPSGLTYLDCGDNEITSLPELPSSLTELHCSSNQLTSLPELPSSLTELHCGSNQLTTLPELPSSLTELNCVGNQLTSLPELPNSLYWLNCGLNPITSLPELPGDLGVLGCVNCQLINLPELPNSLVVLQFDGNPIECVTNYLDDFIELYAYSLCEDGCTDPQADNYNPNADIDDGSCVVSQACPYENYLEYSSYANFYDISLCVNIIVEG